MKKLNVFLCLMVLVISAIGVNAQTDRRAGSQLKGGGKVGKVAPPTTKRDPETLRVTNVAVGGRVAVLGAPVTASWNDDVVAKLTATGLFTQVDGIIISSASGPSLATLQQYQAVLVYTDQGVSNATLGDALADYSDGGGAVVVMVFAQFPAFGLTGGRFANGTYQVIQGNGTSGATSQTLGTIPVHPIFTGVTNFSGGSSSYHTNALADPAATVVASWADGTVFAATRPAPLGGKTRVDINFYPPSSDVRGDFWTSSTDGARLMANALLFAAGGNAGGPTNVNSQVNFQTTQQNLGGVAPAFCTGLGYNATQYNLNVTLTNIGTNTFTSPFYQVVELQAAGGVAPALPFRLRTADDFNGATCSGGLVGSTQAIAASMPPQNAQATNFQIVLPAVRRFRFIVNVFATIGSVGNNRTTSPVKMGQLAVEATGFDKAGNPILSSVFTPENGVPSFAVNRVSGSVKK